MLLVPGPSPFIKVFFFGSKKNAPLEFFFFGMQSQRRLDLEYHSHTAEREGDLVVGVPSVMGIDISRRPPKTTPGLGDGWAPTLGSKAGSHIFHLINFSSIGTKKKDWNTAEDGCDLAIFGQINPTLLSYM